MMGERLAAVTLRCVGLASEAVARVESEGGTELSP